MDSAGEDYPSSVGRERAGVQDQLGI